MAAHDDEAQRIRKALDEADQALVAALEARAKAIRALGALREQAPDAHLPLPRDVDVVTRAAERVVEFPKESVGSVLREVLSASERMLAPVHVAFVGPEAGFAHLAARACFGDAAELRAVDSVLAVLEEVQRDRARFGVVPLETSSDGALTATLHGLLEADVQICREETVPASYHLLSRNGTPSTIEKIYAARTALAACERFLRQQHPKAMAIDVPSGAVAVELASQDEASAALGTDFVRGQHGLRALRERVEDETGIEIRFAVVGKEHPARTGCDRTVLALAVHDEPGALYAALQPFADRGINLVRLESRPSRNPAWRFLFFVEMDGHVTDRGLLAALEELRTGTRFLKVLGSYPRPT